MSIDFSKPVENGNGPIRILCTDKGGEYPVVGIDGCGRILTWTIDGQYFHNYTCGDLKYNLRNTPVVHEGWINVYPNNGMMGPLHSTKASAILAGDSDRKIACIKIKYTEGEGI